VPIGEGDAVGPNVKQMNDANSAYRWHEAVLLARRGEPYDVFRFEEPVASDDCESHRKLTQATMVPIATGENEYTRYRFCDFIKHDASAILHDASAILNADAEILGGSPSS